MSPSTETLLVTGATGFLGSAIAAELLERKTDAQLLFLVRCDYAGAGLERLRSSIAKLEPSPAALGRLDESMVICGDLASFPAQIADSRVRATTRILNAAALASFAWKPEVWNVNVEHTTAFARAAAQLPALRRFLYVGTAMISGNTADRNVQEDEFPAKVRQFVPYTKSKAEIERRLPEALGGVPLVIARPSIVVGHTRLGCTLSPSIFWMFRMIHAARRIPFPPSNRVDIIPVDYCARALIHLLQKEHLAHARYHVSAGPERSCTLAEIDRAYCAAQKETGLPELAEFDIADLKSMEGQYQEWFGPCDTRRMTSAVHIYQAFAGLNVTFDNRRLLAEGMTAPPRLTDYLEACVRTGQDMTIAEQMLYDFR
jgi:nucleoside-diphosphate-sugar epimerase